MILLFSILLISWFWHIFLQREHFSILYAIILKIKHRGTLHDPTLPLQVKQTILPMLRTILTCTRST